MFYVICRKLNVHKFEISNANLLGSSTRLYTTQITTHGTTHEKNIVYVFYINVNAFFLASDKTGKNKAHSPERVNKSVIITLYKWISYIWLTLLSSHLV